MVGAASLVFTIMFIGGMFGFLQATQRFGDPGRGVHSIQAEINRALYLEERTVTKTAGFAVLERDLLALAGVLAKAARRP